MIDLILYIAMFFASLSIGGLAYGLVNKWLENHQLTQTKAVRPQSVKVNQ